MTLATGRRPTQLQRGPWVPAPTLVRLLAPVIADRGVMHVAALAGVTTRMIWAWTHGETAWVSFAVADRVVTDVLDEPGLWLTDAELAAVYSELDR